MHVCIYVFLYVSMLEDANEERGCEGVHVFRKDLSTTPLKGSSSLHEADVRGGVSPTSCFPSPFSSVDAAAQFYSNRIFIVLRHKAEVRGYSWTEAIAPHI